MPNVASMSVNLDRFIIGLRSSMDLSGHSFNQGALYATLHVRPCCSPLMRRCRVALPSVVIGMTLHSEGLTDVIGI